MNSECFLNEDDLDLAKELCKYIEDDATRNKAVANCLAVDMAKQILDDDSIDYTSGLYHIDEIQEDFDMSDIYINGSCVCVRYCIDNKIYIPKSHFEYGINPVAYMCIQPNGDFSGAILKGFLASENINKSVVENGFYVVDGDELVSYYDIEPLLQNYEEEPLNQDFCICAFDFIDKKNYDKEILFRTLTKNKDARIYLKDLSDSKKTFNYIQLQEVSEDSPEKQAELNIEQGINELEILNDNSLEEDTLDPSGDFSEELVLADDNAESLVLSDLSEDLLNTDDTGFELEETSPQAELETSEEFLNNEIQEDNDQDLQIDTESELNENLETLDSEINTLEEDFGLELQEDSTVEEPSESAEDFSLENYETVVTPSLDFEEDNSAPVEAEDNQSSLSNYDVSDQENIEQLSDMADDFEQIADAEENNFTSVQASEIPESPQEEPQDENQIQELFDDNSEIETVMGASFTPKAKKKNNFAPFLLLIIIAGLAAGGYFGYQKYLNSNNKLTNVPETDKNTEVLEETLLPEQKEDAMPIETVEKVETPKPVEEGLNVSIPAIEKNLDASILVSNLSINWEVPSNYITNSSAKRYFVKIGKIIQLNLKTELLLLNKMPITNKITVELTYNKDTGHFEIKDMPLKSGEQVIDDTIKTTVSNVLRMNLNINTSSFANTQGNPVLVIHL